MTDRSTDATYKELPRSLFIRANYLVAGVVQATTYPFPDSTEYILASAVSETGATDRNAALEEAAQILDARERVCLQWNDTDEAKNCKADANTIRALKTPAPQVAETVRSGAAHSGGNQPAEAGPSASSAIDATPRTDAELDRSAHGVHLGDLVALCRQLERESRTFMRLAHEWKERAEAHQSATAAIDLDVDDWKRIKDAAGKSPWITEDYTQNDWVADVCAYLLGTLENYP